MSLERSSISRGIVAGIAAAAIAGVVGLADTASAGTIYEDSFSRTGPLNASTPSPTDTNSETWAAGTAISTATTSGGYASITGTSNSMAYLPFSPVQGNIYTLTASLNPTPGTTTNWLAIGFFPQGSSTVSSAPNADASVMLLERDNRGSQVFNGDGTSVDGPTSPNNPGPTTWSITLNTTQPDWTVNFSEVGVPDETNFQTFIYGGSTPNPTINTVGFGAFGMSGTVQDFTLTSAVPEPTTLGLMGIGSIGLLLLKRREAF